jgi:MarR family transcriptional regulator, transcriptional regulator for hemolysin
MDLRHEFVDRLSKVSRRWRTRLDAEFRRTGLTLARARTLLLLSREDGPLTQKDLAEHLAIETPTLVRLLDGLVGQGLVERRPLPGDRRANAVVLTKAAAPHVAEADAVSKRVRGEILEDIPERDLATAIRVLDRIAMRLQGEACAPRPSEPGRPA